MKKLILPVVFFYSFSISVFSQWTQENIGTTEDLYSVDYFSANDIWIGSFNQFIKTSDGGTNWIVTNPMKDLSNASILPANVNDISMISSTTAVATGLFYMGNSEVILRTTNSGVNWDQVTVNNSVPLLRYINSVDKWGSNMVAVGNTGRIFRSTNSGASWTLINSGVTNMIYDVKYVSADTIIACGTNIMLRSFDGGLNWSSTVVSGEYINLDVNGNVMYAVQDYGGVIRSTDHGVSFSNVTVPFITRGGVYCVSDDTILIAASDGLYITRNGATSWEKYQLNNYQPITMIDFLSTGVAYAVGLGGYVIKTSNLNAAPTLPIADFSITGTTNYCLNDVINLNNETYPDPSYSYQWRVDGVTISNSYNANYTLVNGGAHTVSLVVTNVYGTDTVSQAINVIGHTISPITYSVTDDTVCSGNYTGFMVLNSQSGVSYQLRKGSVNVGTAQSGNGGTLIFSSGSAITTQQIFNIKATKSTICFIDSLVEYITINVTANPAIPAPICTPSNSQNTINPSDPGINHFIFGDINNSSTPYFNNYYNYTCCYHTDVTMGQTYPMFIDVNNNYEFVTVWMDLNSNGTFDYPSERIIDCNQVVDTETVFYTIPTVTTFNQNIRMRVISNSSSFSVSSACSGFSTYEIEDYSVTILPAPVPPVANFTFTTNESCATTATFTNTSYNAISYLWDFGDGSPTESTMNASHVYSLDGTYTITLIVTNPYGADTVTQTISVIIPLVPPTACAPSVNSGYCPAGDRPYMTMIQVPSNSINELMSGNVRDYTCDIQMMFEADTFHTVYLNTNGEGNYTVAYLDADTNGVFDNNEALGPDGNPQNYGNIGVSGWGNYLMLHIPAFAQDSTALRLRIFMSTNFVHYSSLCANYCGDYKDFTVFATAPPLKTRFSVYEDTVCMNDSVAVTFQNPSRGDVAWLWDFGDGDFSTQQYPTHYYTANGTYTVKLKTWGQNGETDSLTKTNFITVQQGLPVPNIVYTNDSLYTNANATSYEWYRNSVLISGATDSLYLPTLDGVYKVGAVNSNGCVTFSANFSYYPPRPNFTASPLTSCPGVYTYLTNASANCTSYVIDWGDGTTPVNWNGSGGPFHIYNIAGTFDVKLKGCNVNFGCDSLIRSAYITVNPLPTMPVITYVNPNLVTSAGYSTYQWYRNGSILSGATSNSYTPSQTGNYTVKVTNAGGCNITSAIYTHYPVTVAFAADTSGYCGVNTASVQFTNTCTNATSYTWYFGDGNTSALAAPSHTYLNPGLYTVKLVACGTSCDSLTLTDYIYIDPSPFSVQLSLLTDTLFCYGNTVDIFCTNVPGASYQWIYDNYTLPGETDTILHIYDAGNYWVNAESSSGCLATSDTIFADADYECVFPGDADWTYNVDQYDLLAIGLNYGSTGTPRSFVSNNWEGYPSADWGIMSQWADIKHADCNGDGSIDAADTLAINLNFSAQHNFTGNTERSAYPDIYLSTTSAIYEAGDWVDVDVLLGNINEQVTDLYGLGFEIFANLQYVEPGTAKMIYSDSWLTDLNTDGLTFSKIVDADNAIYNSLTRVSHTGKSGYGKLGTFRFQVLNSLAVSTSMTLYVSDGYGIDPYENYLTFDLNNAIYLSLEPSSVSVDVNEIISGFSVWPNPFTENFTMNLEISQNSEVRYELKNALGQTLISKSAGNLNSGKYQFDILTEEEMLPSGIYFLNVYAGNTHLIKKIVKNN